jgi:hypothetical protein
MSADYARDHRNWDMTVKYGRHVPVLVILDAWAASSRSQAARAVLGFVGAGSASAEQARGVKAAMAAPRTAAPAAAR